MSVSVRMSPRPYLRIFGIFALKYFRTSVRSVFSVVKPFFPTTKKRYDLRRTVFFASVSRGFYLDVKPY